MNNSIWAEISLPSFSPLSQDTKTDVLIVGGGLAGLLCAYTLQQAGVEYLLVEADTICSGVTRNTTAKLTSQHGLIYDKLTKSFGVDAARAYYDANEAALARYRELSQTIRCDFEEKPAYVYSTDGTSKLERELLALQRIGARASLVYQLPLPVKTTGAIRFDHQAQFHPLKFAAAISQGLHICEHTRVLAFEKNTCITDHGTIRAEKIIIATHFPMLNKHGAYFLKLYQHRSYVLALQHAQKLDGMYVDEDTAGLSFRNYGNLLLLGGGSHRTGKKGGSWQALSQFAHEQYPDAREVCRWATQDCMSLDAVPYIGRYGGGTQELYVASGFNKWGMTSSMAAAAILSDLVQGRKNAYAEVFSPQRSMLHPQLGANALETVANLLRPAKPRCPHMGCALHWNESERSWDCSCHGSRFTKAGHLLDNPATADLKKP